jgi:hypothetical protein
VHIFLFPPYLNCLLSQQINFQVLAPRCLTAKEGSGKIQYQHTEVPAESFTVVKGMEHLKTYHVATSGKVPVAEDDSRRGAHAFCARCGVHVLFARSQKSSTVDINVQCFDAGIRKLQVTSTNDSISEGVAIPGQWGGVEGDHQLLSTISEGTSLRTSRSLFHSPLVSSSSSRESYKLYGTSATPQSFPATPTTTSTNDSCISSHGGTDQDSFIGDTESTTSVGSFSQRGPTPTFSQTMSQDHRHDPFAASSPALQNQMRYYMRKHLSSPVPSSNTTSTNGELRREEKAKISHKT